MKDSRIQFKRHRWHAAWYEGHPGRLVLEKKAMNLKFPQFVLKRMGDQLAWVGKLHTNRGNIYEVAIVYPDDFPSSHPRAYVVYPSVEDSKHQYHDGALCLFYPGDRSYAPEQTTAATVVAWTATWLFCYEEYERTGSWPGREFD